MNFNKHLFVLFILLIGCTQTKENTKTVEISCGQCQFGLSSQEGCDLAIRIDGKSYFVDGAHIDDFGDAHELKVGFCEVIRKATVTGELIDNRYKISSIQLID